MANNEISQLNELEQVWIPSIFLLLSYLSLHVEDHLHSWHNKTARRWIRYSGLCYRWTKAKVWNASQILFINGKRIFSPSSPLSIPLGYPGRTDQENGTHSTLLSNSMLKLFFSRRQRTARTTRQSRNKIPSIKLLTPFLCLQTKQQKENPNN